MCLDFGETSQMENQETGTINITYNSLNPIKGFQFNIEGTDIGDADGGLAEEYDFDISTNNSTLLGFNLNAGVIPAGSAGVLTIVEYTATANQACLELGIGAISDALGQALPVSFGDCVDIDYECPDVDADDICDDVDDCVGEYDECGICGGSGIPDDECDCDGNVLDCNGECGGAEVIEECDECSGSVNK